MCMLHKKRFLSRKCRAPFSQLLKVPVLLSHCLFVLCWIMQCQPDTRMHVNQMTGDNLSFGEHRRHNAFSTNLTVCTNRQTIWMFFIWINILRCGLSVDLWLHHRFPLTHCSFRWGKLQSAWYLHRTALNRVRVHGSVQYTMCLSWTCHRPFPYSDRKCWIGLFFFFYL